MDTEEIKQTTETKHLGIKRNNKNNIDIEDRMKLARRTIYALLVPGLHARRGMSPVIAYKSFASLVYDKLRKYKLPDLMDLMENPIEKHKWKKLVKQQIEIYWEEAWIEEKQTKSTLKFLNIQHPLFGNSHQVWKTVPKNSMEVKKAEVKARLLTGTYMLKETKANFSRNTDTPLCELCCEETEDVKHFLLICPTPNDIREEHLYTLKCYLNSIQEGAYEAICENKQLNTTHP
jgi:hypothetical protein